MAESPLKRQREETHDVEDYNFEESSKRHKSYNHILSILDEEEEEPSQDLSPILTALQQELFCDPTTTTTTFDTLPGPTSESGTVLATSESSLSSDFEENERESVIRHLLEASDDELGIPNRLEEGGVDEINGGDHTVSLYDGLWEFEDEAANYYALLQSELFM